MVFFKIPVDKLLNVVPFILPTVVAKDPVPLPVTSPVKVIVWSPVLLPLKVVMPNFVFIVVTVSSPVFVPDVLDNTPDCTSVT